MSLTNVTPTTLDIADYYKEILPEICSDVSTVLVSISSSKGVFVLIANILLICALMRTTPRGQTVRCVPPLFCD